MNFYHSTRRRYCGIDLHSRSLYICILDQHGEVLLHKEIKARPELLLATLILAREVDVGLAARFLAAFLFGIRAR